MHICMVTSSYPRYPGDIAGTFILALAQAITELGHQVSVVAPADPTATHSETGPIPVTRFRYSPVPGIQPMGYGKALENDQRLRFSAYACAPPYLISGVWQLLKTAQRFSADVIHAHWVLPNGPVGLLASTIARKPLVTTLHGSDVYLAKRSPVLGWLAGKSLAGSRAVTACSPDLAQDAQVLGASEERTHLIPWGADPRRFGSGDGLRWRERLGIEPWQPVVLGVGRLVEKKGFLHLVEAFHQISKDHPEAMLVLGGEGPARRELETWARQLGVAANVRFSGRVPWEEMPDLLAMADVVVAPSIRDASGNQDGLPTVVLEAMAAGKPVVASNVAGLPLVVEHEGTGLLVPPQDVPALAGALHALLSEPERARSYGCAGRRRVETELNWRAIGARYVEVYSQAMGNQACAS